jgi:hypothetical protein
LPPTVVLTLNNGVKHGRYEADDVKVPEYNGHPGTVVLGGARPPPQSRGSQISPVSGSMLWRGPSPHWVRVRRSNSHEERAGVVRVRRVRVRVRKRSILILFGVVLVVMAIVLMGLGRAQDARRMTEPS